MCQAPILLLQVCIDKVETFFKTKQLPYVYVHRNDVDVQPLSFSYYGGPSVATYAGQEHDKRGACRKVDALNSDGSMHTCTQNQK